MAIEFSVTVSIGDDTNGVLREMRRVTGVSRVTSETGKPFPKTTSTLRADFMRKIVEKNG
jgi:hypothetical protein